MTSLITPGTAAAGEDLYKAGPGPYSVDTVDREWSDGARNRAVPARLFIPRAPAGQTFPVVVFSHGLWADRTSYGYFARHLASHGYVVILPQHLGSDVDAMLCLTCDVGLATDWLLENPVRGALIKLPLNQLLQSSIEDPDNLVDRPLDISFAIDQIATDPALSPVTDPGRVGVAGHSFGAYTAMAAGGMLVDLPDEWGGLDRSFRDMRIRATLAMSAQGPGTMGISDGAWSAFGTPAMFLTGTFDYGPDADAWRRTPFDRIRGFERYLLTLKGADHATFAHRSDWATSAEAQTGLFAAMAGAGLELPNPLLDHVDLIQSMGVAFFDTYLKQDPSSRDWLNAYFAAPHPDAVGESRSD